MKFHIVEIDKKIIECTGYIFGCDTVEEIQRNIFPINSKLRYNIYDTEEDTEYYINSYEDFEGFKGEYIV